MKPFDKILHGGDYNPEQWRKTPEVWLQDIEYMKKAGCNAMSVGIFSWAMLEPRESEYDFGWLDTIVDLFEKNDISMILATPSGARPFWMAHKYPEVLRTQPDRVRNLPGERHNHCYTSPIYREKVRNINTLLAERYKNSKALILWHISNEINGECHCELCQNAFREWLKVKYNNDLDLLNEKWWTTFWSQTYTEWEQIQSPAINGQGHVMALNLDWKRFVTHQSLEFFKNEIEPIRKITPDIPVTINGMYLFTDIDYWKFAKELDIISLDSYPLWNREADNIVLAREVSLIDDMYRSYMDKPFLLMESTPSMTNWHETGKLKRPKIHELFAMQTISHGADSILYFQWRKSRGSSEKLHGAVVDHSMRDDTRVFKDVANLGKKLSGLGHIVGAKTKTEVAIILDNENLWAIDFSEGPRRDKGYIRAVKEQYEYFWNNGISVDIINEDCDFSKYKMIIAPMLYMVREGVAERLESFTENGGTFVMTYWSGIVDENDLCFLGGFPGPLRRLAGIWSEELDSCYDYDKNSIEFLDGNQLSIKGEFETNVYHDLIHTETATALAVYKSDFYKGRPALTVNEFGKGKVYYIASRNSSEFNREFYERICKQAGIEYLSDKPLPEGVTINRRINKGKEYLFVLNFGNESAMVSVRGRDYTVDSCDYLIIEG